jgi:D-sedoheptulose 7-phosphate isomerase
MTVTGTASIVADHFARSIATTGSFFDQAAPLVAECCRRMADRFSAGGILLVTGEGAQASDANHVAVEFVHPVIVGKRALPAVALTAHPGREVSLCALARPTDILVALCADRVSPVMRARLAAARAKGLFTILITGRASDPVATVLADVVFAIDDDDTFVVQEVAETLYHVLWELVHVFFEIDAAHLVPFLPPPPGQARPDELLAAVQSSTIVKAREICALRQALRASAGAGISDAGRAFAARVRAGGRLLAFGNGGSATDAQDAAADCLIPRLPQWRVIPAMALVDDIGVVSAVANDVGFEHVFARQVIAFGRPDDIALGFSTSGASRNVLAAMSEARARGLLTIAMSGGDGGELARTRAVDCCFTAPSEHIPRIQEAHATAWHALLSSAQEELS